MYEEQTFDVILTRLLARVKDTLDKQEGSIIYDALAPAAVELANCYTALDTILEESFADTASREYLIRRCKERGIIPEEATYAVMEGKFNIDIPIGSRFNLGSYNYTATEKISDGVYKMLCDTAGEAPNSVLGDLTPIEYITGLVTAALTACLVPGEDAEGTEALRNRYLESFKSDAYGGNIADYKEKVNAIQGVGGVKVFPAWQGGGTVKLVIISSDYGVPTNDVVALVQKTMQPLNGDGVPDLTTSGTGLAPIGHLVTVVPAQSVSVNITATLSYLSGYSWNDVKSTVLSAIDDYYKSLGQSWASETNLVVRKSRIETRILDITGISDVEDITLNGGSGNLTLSDNDLPIRGTFNGS